MINSRFAIFLLLVGAVPGCLCHASGSQRQMWWGRSFLNLTQTSHLCFEIPLEFQHWCLLWLPVLLSCAKTLWCAQMVTGDYRRSSDLRQIEFNLWPLEVSFLVGVAPVFHQSLLILGRWGPLSVCAKWLLETPRDGFFFCCCFTAWRKKCLTVHNPVLSRFLDINCGSFWHCLPSQGLHTCSALCPDCSH